MTGIAARLADALATLAPDHPVLAEYRDTTRPLEVGERVRVKAGTVHGTSDLGTGATGTVVKAYAWDFAEVDIDGQPYPIPGGGGWTYKLGELERIRE
jgi:hypothetical protein